MFLAQQIAEVVKTPESRACISPLGFGTAPGGVCSWAIRGTGYTVGRFKDGSALAVLNRTGFVYGIAEAAADSVVELWAKVGRLLTELDEPTRARQTMECGTPIARGACGITWYRIAETVWCVQSATQCHYCGLWSEWTMPQHADPADTAEARAEADNAAEDPERWDGLA